MKKVLLRVVYGVILVVTSYVAYFAWSYQSVDNVFLEMNHAAVHYENNILHLPNWSSVNVLGLPNLSTVLESERRYKDTYQIIRLPIQTGLPQKEDIVVIVGQYQTFGLEFRKELEENIFLYITFTYKDDKLIEGVEISNSDISLSDALQGYYVDKKKEAVSNKQESLELTYWFSSSRGLPTLQLTHPKDVLDYLKPYDIDEQWIQEKSEYMLYNIILKRWFENGSQRYSFENLGKVEIVSLDFRK